MATSFLLSLPPARSSGKKKFLSLTPSFPLSASQGEPSANMPGGMALDNLRLYQVSDDQRAWTSAKLLLCPSSSPQRCLTLLSTPRTQILNLTRTDATPEDVKRAYRMRAIAKVYARNQQAVVQYLQPPQPITKQRD